MTPWELAQSWPHEGKVKDDDETCTLPCHRCQLEQWVRETAGQWIQNAQDHGQKNRRENEIAWAITEAHVADLGVPEEQ